MSRLFACLLPLFLVSCQRPSFTHSSDPPTFHSVQEALKFINHKVWMYDAQGLAGACVGEYATIKHNPNIYHIMNEISGLHIRWRYRNESFPSRWPCFLAWLCDMIEQMFGIDTRLKPELERSCRSSFKLGGHGHEYNHIHIDFVRRPDGWYLSNIWQCR